MRRLGLFACSLLGACAEPHAAVSVPRAAASATDAPAAAPVVEPITAAPQPVPRDDLAELYSAAPCQWKARLDNEQRVALRLNSERAPYAYFRSGAALVDAVGEGSATRVRILTQQGAFALRSVAKPGDVALHVAEPRLFGGFVRVVQDGALTLEQLTAGDAAVSFRPLPGGGVRLKPELVREVVPCAELSLAVTARAVSHGTRTTRAVLNGGQAVPLSLEAGAKPVAWLWAESLQCAEIEEIRDNAALMRLDGGDHVVTAWVPARALTSGHCLAPGRLGPPIGPVHFGREHETGRCAEDVPLSVHMPSGASAEVGVIRANGTFFPAGWSDQQVLVSIAGTRLEPAAGVTFWVEASAVKDCQFRGSRTRLEPSHGRFGG